MNISDIAKVKVDWMENFGNDPMLKFVLKRGKNLTPNDDFRWRQSGDLFYAEAGGEVQFYHHDRRNHNGFGFRQFCLHMADDWNASNWKDCEHSERDFGSYGSRDVSCHLDGRVLTLTGPWSSNESAISRLIGPSCAVSVMPSEWRQSITHPESYQRELRKRGKGHAYDGLYLACSLLLPFVQDALDCLAPHLEMYEGDYGWYPKFRGCEPKNPRKGRPYQSRSMSAQQCLIIGR